MLRRWWSRLSCGLRADASAEDGSSGCSLSSLPLTLPRPEDVRELGTLLTSSWVDAQVHKVPFRGEWLIVKSSRLLSESEGASIHFVSEHSSLPVAKFYGSIGFDDRLYLYQSLLPGRPLSTILWGLSADQRAASAVPVFSALKDLWGLPRPGYVGGFNRRGRGALGGFSEPPLPPGEVERRGTPSQYPIDMWWPTMSDFYDYVRQNYLRKGGDPAHWDTEVEPGLDRDAEPVFVHCDIAARNLLFDDDLRLTGIIDFNPVGWYPLEVQWLLLCDELDNCREQGRVEETFLEALVAAVADRLTSSARHAATFWWRGLNGSRLPPAYKRGTMGEA